MLLECAYFDCRCVSIQILYGKIEDTYELYIYTSYLKVPKEESLDWQLLLLWHHHLTTHLQNHRSNCSCPL